MYRKSSPWDYLPRHAKGYLWIAFLVAIFLVMTLSENNAFDGRLAFSNPIPVPAGSPGLETVTTSTRTGAGAGTGEVETQDVIDTVIEEQRGNYAVSTGLDPKDVVILVKTGATSIWRRMPGHMSTTLGDPALTPNIIYYSDSPDNINGNEVIDVLANVSSTLKQSPDFRLYNNSKEVAENNLYLETGSMEGDSYLPGGWRLDKYKFVPMFQHAANTLPGKKWYIYMEDDNYYFWETFYAWLATLDHTSLLMLGSPAFRLGEDFAHGGSGFALTGAALSKSFGADPHLADKWEEYAREQCCGDQVLSHVLRQHGVERYAGLDGSGWAALQALPTWRIGFGTWNWCSPLMNVHKVHQADLSRLWVFEQEFKASTGRKGRMRYRDLFERFAGPHMRRAARRSEWDNYAQAKSFSSSSDPDISGEGKKKLSASELESKPWYSSQACEKACVEWKECLTWKYADDACSMDHTAAMGQRIDAGIRMESGWMLDRIEKLEDTTCKDLAF
jgi:hypothetical protein